MDYEVISEFEAAEDEYEAETLGPAEEETEEEETSEDDSATEEPKAEKIDYDSMTVPDLKAALKEKGLPVSGKKAELIDRLKGGSE